MTISGDGRSRPRETRMLRCRAVRSSAEAAPARHSSTQGRGTISLRESSRSHALGQEDRRPRFREAAIDRRTAAAARHRRVGSATRQASRVGDVEAPRAESRWSGNSRAGEAQGVARVRLRTPVRFLRRRNIQPRDGRSARRRCARGGATAEHVLGFPPPNARARLGDAAEDADPDNAVGQAQFASQGRGTTRRCLSPAERDGDMALTAVVGPRRSATRARFDPGSGTSSPRHDAARHFVFGAPLAQASPLSHPTRRDHAACARKANNCKRLGAPRRPTTHVIRHASRTQRDQ